MLENSRKSERLETELCNEKQGAPSLSSVTVVGGPGGGRGGRVCTLATGRPAFRAENVDNDCPSSDTQSHWRLRRIFESG
jgi:hypothetical protein